MKNGNLRSKHTKLVKAKRNQEKLEIYDTPIGANENNWES